MCALAQTAKCPEYMLHAMGANEHMHEAIERHKGEVPPAKDTPTGELESSEYSHKEQQETTQNS